MIEHENDFKPGPLTVTGFKGESCNQANWHDSNRIPFEPTAKGHRWVGIQTAYELRIRIKMMSENDSGRKNKTKLHTLSGCPDFMELYPEIALSGFDDGFVMTEFRRQTDRMAIYLEKKGTIAPDAYTCTFTSFDETECIKHGKTFKSSYIAGKCPSGFLGSKTPDFNKSAKTPIQRRKTNQTNWMARLIKWQEYPADFGMKLCYKLIKN